MELARVGMPINGLPKSDIAGIREGGAAMCSQAGIPIAGGHPIDSVEPIYGLAAMGLAHPDHIKRNSDAQAGDVLVLGQALGMGFLSAALEKNHSDADGYSAQINHTTQFTRAGPTPSGPSGANAHPQAHGLRPLWPSP